MKIGIDGLVLRGRDAGSLRYFQGLISGLASAGVDHEYIVFSNQEVFSTIEFPRHKNFIHRDIRGLNFLPSALKQQLYFACSSVQPVDLLHCPVFIPPLSYHGKTVMTVFDLTYRLYPQTMKWTGAFWWRLLGKRGTQKADRLITISNSTKRDLCRNMDIPEEKIEVIYPYIQEKFQPVPNARSVAAKYGLPEAFILYVGTLERRKNIANLIRSFALARQIGSLKHPLVLVGQRGWLYEDIDRTVQELNLKSDLIFLGHVPDDDLPALYSAADLFVFLSLYEGFGLPVLEAMACGTPVLASNVSSIPEVAGDAGTLVPPENIEHIASEMSAILSDPDRRRRMSEKGLLRVHEFTRERFVRQILHVYNQVLN
jgi:glycosyltransferase involved in cell wall biosynthesis